MTSEKNDAMQAAMIVELDVIIPMSDGIPLVADVFRPDREGTFPVLVTYGPYAKALHFEDGYRDQWNRLVEHHPEVTRDTSSVYASWELPDPERWVTYGYVCVRVDSRGAGRSSGMIDPWSPREAQDVVECVEWAGTQPWSSGRVGLTGVSYYSMVQWQAAALKPRHLAAMCAWEGSSDIYREMIRHGGILCAFVDGWYDAQVLRVQHGLGDRAVTSRIDGRSITGEERLSDEELAANRIDFSAVMRQRPYDDAHWKARRADLSRVEVPLLSAANWGGPPHLRGNVEGYLGAASEQKWLEFHGLEHWTHFYTDYGVALQREFFDHFLKGEANGWNERPSVIMNARRVDGTFEHRAETSWPLAGTQWTRFYLHPESLELSTNPPDADTTATYASDSEGLTFTHLVERELEITGPLAAKLFVSADSKDADVFVVVRVFDPEGAEVRFIGVVDPSMPITTGWLRASRRELDEERSTPWRPYHRHERDLWLTPGEVTELDVEIWPTSVIVPAGYTLAVTVQGRDYYHGESEGDFSWIGSMTGVGPFQHRDVDDRANTMTGTVTLHSSPEKGSFVLLPVIGARKG